MADNYDRTAILESFFDEVNAYLPDIRADLDRLQQAPGDTRALEESFRRTHTIAGSAAMMGFQSLARVAGGMEETLGDALGHEHPLDAPTVALLRRSLGRLERLLGDIRTNADGASIASEDDADRAAWRGTGSAGGARPADLAAASDTGFGRAGMSGVLPNGTGAPGAPTDGQRHGRMSPPSMPIQIPSWLAAFRNGPDGSGPTSGQASAVGGLPGDIASMPTASPSGPQRGGPSGALATEWGAPPAGSPAQAPSTQGPNGSQPRAMPGQMGQMGQASIPTDGSPFSNTPAWQSSSANIFDATTVDMATMGTESMPTVPHAGPSGAPMGPGSMASASPFSMPSSPNASFGGPGPLTPGPSSSAHHTPGAPSASDVALQWTSPVAATASGASQPSPRMGQPPTSGGEGEAALDELRADTLAVQAQVDTLRDVIQKLQAAMQESETERGELRGFLDSSTDAIDRLEAWVRQQTGINLPPGQMREYLPLSVIYVVTTRLMNLSTMLRDSGRDLQVSEEQIDETLGELRRAIEQTGHLYRAVNQVGGTPDQGFQATVAQFAWAPPQAAGPGPTATESLSPAARAEMERQARDELRRELEDEVRAELAMDVRRDETQRLRHELEIEVRRDLLKEIMPGAGDSLTNISSLAETMARMPAASGGSRSVQITSEQSPEALEVFRDEAMDHLREITESITQLEISQNSHDDLATLQRIRRAMHTLKGAAGMMGFTTIQEVAHASEDVLDRMSEGTTTFNPAVLSLLLETSEALDQMISGRLVDPGEQQRVARDLIAHYATFGGTVSPTVVDRAANAPEATTGRASTDDELDEARGLVATSPDLSVRLQVRELDHLISLFGELVSTRAVLEERMGRLGQLVGDTVNVSDRLQGVGSQLETQFEAATLPAGGPSAANPGMGMPAYGGYPGAPGMAPGMAPGGQFPPGAGYPPAGYPPAGYPPAGFPGAGYAQRPGGMARPAGQRGGHVGEFDELELDRYTEFHRISRGLMEGIADATTLSHEMELLIREVLTAIERESRLSAEFQARLLKAGLVKIQTLAPRLLRAARTTATKAGKEIEFFVEGGDTEVERRVIESIEGPLLHLVRNAVAHGIEPPEERVRLGKPRAGRITLVARYESNQVAITVADDGAGIDPQRVRAAAVEHGWADESALNSPRDTFDLIFRPGFTTATTITEESGRGVGLDVVRDVATRLRGTAEVDSRVGQGSIFTLKLPINLQIARAVLVRVDKQVVAIPMLSVGEIARLEYFPRVPGDDHAVDVRGEPYTLVHLGSYLNPGIRPRVDARTPVLLIAAGRQRIALLIDEIQSQKEIVAKPLGPHLRDVRGIAGATVLGNGQVVLILDVQELLSTPPRGEMSIPASLSTEQADGGMASAHPTEPFSRSAGAAWNQITQHSAAAVAGGPPTEASRGFVITPRDGRGAASGTGGQGSYLLVVDDSPTVRRVVGGMLKSHGWRVETARDGIEALDMIGRERPAAVLLDIEMPRMDGYELMATVRSQDAYKSLPLVVLTSRAAAKHRQRAVQLGASAYIVKPYQEDDLLTTISRLVQAQG